MLYDPASDARLSGQHAERMFTQDSINVVFGGYTSTSRKAMLPVVEKHNRLLFYPQLRIPMGWTPLLKSIPLHTSP